jgi:hypothetical protein
MNADPRNEDLERAIDEALASMVEGEPRRVNSVSVRQAIGDTRSSRIPVWLAVAAVLIAGLAVAMRARPPVASAPVGVARSVTPPSPVEIRSTPSPNSTQSTSPASGRATTPFRLAATTATEPANEGLPRLTIASIDLPEPLSTSRLAAEAIQIPSIDIPPLSLADLSIEQHK